MCPRLAVVAGMRVMRIFVALSVLELSAVVPRAAATTFLHLPTERIARAADRIVVGLVVATEARWEGKRIATRVWMRPDGASAAVAFDVAGGTLDGVTMQVIGMPGFAPGERAVVMLARRGGGLRLVGLSDGKLPIAREDGDEVVRLRLRVDGPLEAVPVREALERLVRALAPAEVRP